MAHVRTSFTSESTDSTGFVKGFNLTEKNADVGWSRRSKLEDRERMIRYARRDGKLSFGGDIEKGVRRSCLSPFVGTMKEQE